MILVAGATGLLGTEICRRLRAKGLPVRAFSRPTSARRAELEAMGAEIFAGDLRNPADVERACANVTAVISTATAMGSKDKGLRIRDIDRDAQLSLVRIAKESGVEHFVFVSATPTLDSSAPLIGYKRVVENAVRTSGMTWTILQPVAFTEVWLSKELGWDFEAGTATIFGPGVDAMRYISIRDVAEFAVLALSDPRLRNRDVPMAGPHPWRPLDVVALFEQLSERPWKKKHVPLFVLRTLRPVVALFNEGAASGMAMGAQTRAGDGVDVTLQQSIGLELVTVEEYARQVLKR